MNQQEIGERDAALRFSLSQKATVDPRWTAWGLAFGGSSLTNSNAVLGTNNVTASTFGFASGEDYHFTTECSPAAAPLGARYDDRTTLDSAHLVGAARLGA